MKLSQARELLRRPSKHHAVTMTTSKLLWENVTDYKICDKTSVILPAGNYLHL